MSNEQDDPLAGDTPPIRHDVDATRSFRQTKRSDALPTSIGRHRVVGLLGEGSFGRVYLGHDDDLDRKVAIKVPRSDRISRPEDVEVYLAEARMVAKLDHPGIVPVYEVGRTRDGLCYFVSKFIEGSDLAYLVTSSRPTHERSAGIVSAIAEGLHHAHSRGLVHRDVKPANILIDSTGNAFIADFGLAIKEENFGKGARHAGTPAYMSPEQAMGEGHRVDGRSDIFSLGVVFFELLCGRRPFHGRTLDELLDQIASTDARPPRQFDDTIPDELERICLKALSKRATERYTTAKGMAEDLRHYSRSSETSINLPRKPFRAPSRPGSTQEATPLPAASDSPESNLRPVRVVPKGLRSFDEHDADFFLELLPGVRDRDGLPESLRFWRTRIQDSDPDRTFSVGLIYGPSGCGKSSLVKAGLIPRLAKPIQVVYIEATPGETEFRLLRGLRKAYPNLELSIGLVDSLTSIRRGRVNGSRHKLVIFVDQFEQWLSVKRGEKAADLIAALRQCDGEHTQAILMVRDDFWLAASRFMRAIEIELIPDRNITLVDLFEPGHARKVLMSFGQAYGCTFRADQQEGAEQATFVERAVEELAEDGKINSVRLALFAELLKGKPWTMATLKNMGGIEGIGVTFLESCFIDRQANPKHRLHRMAAEAVLRALLPESSKDIKGDVKSEDELRIISGYSEHPRDFEELMRILDGELRLITPTEPENSAVDGLESEFVAGRYYQFTHDYLIPSLREWLNRRQRATRQGKAEILLSDGLKSHRIDPRRYLLFGEWLYVTLFLRRRYGKLTKEERKFMELSLSVPLTNIFYLAAFLFFVFLAVSITFWIFNQRTHWP